MQATNDGSTNKVKGSLYIPLRSLHQFFNQTHTCETRLKNGVSNGRFCLQTYVFTKYRYTHYWNVAGAEFEKVWPQIVSDAQLIVTESGVALSRTGCDDTPATLSVKDGIMLNGVPGSDHEPFELDKKGGTMGFCKTAMEKYDLVVTSILLRAFQLAGEAFTVK